MRMNIAVEERTIIERVPAIAPLRILVAHNTYQWRGGEDAVRDSEVSLLIDGGQIVETYDRDNADIGGMSRLVVAKDTFWSTRTTSDLRNRIRSFRPDLIHVHNSFPLVSPSIYWEAAKANIPIVQTLHNYRLLCPQAMFLREERVCEDCLGKVPWRGVVRRCYRNSATQSAVVAAMLGVHQAVGTFRNKVTRYIALNEFCRDKFIAGGLPANRISVKPNFVTVPAFAEGPRSGGLFVGRLSAEKGLSVLLKSLDMLPQLTIDVIGTGPMLEEVSTHPQARGHGAMKRDEVLAHMQSASYLVLPSVWHEVMPLSVVEAFASGLPVVGSRSGAMAELITDGVTGLLSEPGNAQDLAEKIRWAEENPSKMRDMGRNARREYLRAYTPQRNFSQLMAIYRSVLAEH